MSREDASEYPSLLQNFRFYQGYREEGGFIQSAVFMEIPIINFLVGPTKKCLETKLLQIKIVTNH